MARRERAMHEMGCNSRPPRPTDDDGNCLAALAAAEARGRLSTLAEVRELVQDWISDCQKPGGNPAAKLHVKAAMIILLRDIEKV